MFDVRSLIAPMFEAVCLGFVGLVNIRIADASPSGVAPIRARPEGIFHRFLLGRAATEKTSVREAIRARRCYDPHATRNAVARYFFLCCVHHPAPAEADADCWSLYRNGFAINLDCVTRQKTAGQVAFAIKVPSDAENIVTEIAVISRQQFFQAQWRRIVAEQNVERSVSRFVIDVIFCRQFCRANPNRFAEFALCASHSVPARYFILRCVHCRQHKLTARHCNNLFARVNA